MGPGSGERNGPAAAGLRRFARAGFRETTEPIPVISGPAESTVQPPPSPDVTSADQVRPAIAARPKEATVRVLATVALPSRPAARPGSAPARVPDGASAPRGPAQDAPGRQPAGSSPAPEKDADDITEPIPVVTADAEKQAEKPALDPPATRPARPGRPVRPARSARPAPSAQPARPAQPAPSALPARPAQPESVPEPARPAQPDPSGQPDPSAQPDPWAGPDPSAQPDPWAAPDPSAQPDPWAGPDPWAQPGPAEQEATRRWRLSAQPVHAEVPEPQPTEPDRHRSPAAPEPGQTMLRPLFVEADPIEEVVATVRAQAADRESHAARRLWRRIRDNH